MTNVPESSVPKTSDAIQRKPSSPEKKPKVAKKKARIVTISIVLTVILVSASLFLLYKGIGVSASALMNSYSTAYSSEKDNAYAKLYQSAFERAEKNYHVRNTMVISIGNLEESQKLEVLKANDVEFITEDRDSNSGKVTAWLEVEGEGTFVIDLKAAEFIVDNERQYVMVRLPNPELTNITIIKTTRRLFADNWSNGSYSEGVDLALKQRNEASLQIQKALMSNQYIYSSARKVAVSMLQNMVKQFNPDIPELTVDVEFME